MLRQLGAAALAVGLVSAEDKDDLWLPNSKNSGEYSCGNCFKTIGLANASLCNTGMSWSGGKDPFYYRQGPLPTGRPVGAENHVNSDMFEVAPARGLTVSKIQELVGDDWNYMNCRSYLSRYRSGLFDPTDPAKNAAGTGAACVRAPTKEAILTADAEVLAHFKNFATSQGKAWGYPSSYASPGKTPDNVNQFGTGWGGDVPANWCRPYMMDMLCHVAFPQVLGAVNNDATGGDQYYHGRIRAVGQDSCENILSACLRRQPPDSPSDADETSSDFTPYEMRTRTAGAFSLILEQNGAAKFDLPGETMSMEVPRYCELWKGGYGLARAGTGVASAEGDAIYAGAPAAIVTYPSDLNDKQDNNMWDHASWESSSTTAASLLLAFAAVVVAGF